MATRNTQFTKSTTHIAAVQDENRIFDPLPTSKYVQLGTFDSTNSKSQYQQQRVPLQTRQAFGDISNKQFIQTSAIAQFAKTALPTTQAFQHPQFSHQSSSYTIYEDDDDEDEDFDENDDDCFDNDDNGTDDGMDVECRSQTIIVPYTESDDAAFASLNEFSSTVFSQLRERELRHRPLRQYMELRQTDINANMRAILIDWLNEVVQEYKLKTETFYLAVNYVDRVLSYLPVARSKLQLIGVTCMLIASKYEELEPPSVKDFVYITDNTYSREEVMEMELTLLKALEFNMTAITDIDFLRRYLRIVNADAVVSSLASYLSELVLQEYKLVGYPPSIAALSCVVLALHSLNLQFWNASLEYYSGYVLSDLEGCITQLFRLYHDVANSVITLGAVKEKYARSRFCRVSSLMPPATLPCFRM